MSKRRRFDLFPFLMLLPAILFIGVVCLFPLLQSIYMSVTSTKLTTPNVMKLTGLKNYIKLWGDSKFWDSIWFTVIYTVLSTALAYVLGLVAALTMHRRIHGKGLVRMLLLVPWVIPGVVGTYAWQWLLNDQTGIINLVLKQFGLIDKPILWLADVRYARIIVILFTVWKTFSFMAVTILASLQSIDSDITEAAIVDGVNAVQNFRYITLPMVKRESLLAIVMMIMWNFNRMDLIYLMTSGGPMDATEVVSIYSYHMAFSRGNLGYAATVSVAMMAIMSVFLVIYFTIRKRGDDV